MAKTGNSRTKFLPKSGLLLELLNFLCSFWFQFTPVMVQFGWKNQLIISKFTNHCSTLIVCNSSTAAAMFNALDRTYYGKKVLYFPGVLQPFLLSLMQWLGCVFWWVFWSCLWCLGSIFNTGSQPESRSSELSSCGLMSSEDVCEPWTYFFFFLN